MYILLAEFTPARLSIGPVLWEVIRSIQLAVTWTNSRETGQVRRVASRKHFNDYLVQSE